MKIELSTLSSVTTSTIHQEITTLKRKRKEGSVLLFSISIIVLLQTVFPYWVTRQYLQFFTLHTLIYLIYQLWISINRQFSSRKKNRKLTKKESRKHQDDTEHSFVPYEKMKTFEELQNEDEVLTDLMTTQPERQDSWLTSTSISSTIISNNVAALIIVIQPFLFF